jgi:peptidyl-prolyl cis-trans isomerase D
MALGYMRRHKKWLYVFLWLVIAAFIVLYVPALDPTEQGTPNEAVVTIGGLEVSVGEYQRAYSRQRQFYSRLYQGRLDENMLRQLRLEEQVLDGLVIERLVELEAGRLGLTISDEAVAEAISTSPDYQVDGRFIGGNELRRRLELAGLTEQAFAESLRRQLLRERLEALVGDGVVVSDSEAEREFRRQTERVELEYVLVPTERFRDAIEPTDEAVASHFEAERDTYRIPEKRIVSYVLLDRETLRPRVDVTARDISGYYQDHRDEFLQEEEFCARHILVKVRTGGDEDAAGHEEEEARRIAQALLGRVEAGSDFGALAKASSEDLGSGASGGDLGCFPAGRMVPEFDDALYQLDEGQTSGLVRTNFGYHIIRLESLREEKTLPLTEVEERVRVLVTDEKMIDVGEETSIAMAGALADRKTLEEAAAGVDIEVQKSEPFARGETPPVLASPALVARVFEMEAGQAEKEGFGLPQGAVFIELAEIQASRLPELDEARETVTAHLVAEAALEKAHALAEQVRDRARKAGLERAATRVGLVRKETLSPTAPGQPIGDLGTGLALDEVAFSLPEETLSDPVRTADGWAILRVTDHQEFDAETFDRERPRVAASLRQQKEGQVFQAYMGAARERYEVRRNPEAYRRALGQGR